MNNLPVVTISRVDGGHLAICSCGNWELWAVGQPYVDLEATRHRASHGKGY